MLVVVTVHMCVSELEVVVVCDDAKADSKVWEAGCDTSTCYGYHG